MIAQLHQYWDLVRDGRKSAFWAWCESRYWLDQHCLDADDFEFSLGVALRDWMEERKT